MGAGLLTAAVGFLTCGCGYLAKREAHRLPHDPTTGVIVGSEAVTLEPPAGVAPRGEAILMVHGFVGSRSEFADLPQRLAAEGYTVRMMRLPGHGTSPHDFATQTSTTLLRAAEDEFVALRATHGRVAVVGFSMGGSLATLLAARQPVERLALCSPYYGVTPRWYLLLSPERWAALLGPVVPWVPKPKMMVQLNDRTHIDAIQTYRWAPIGGLRAMMQLGAAAFDPATLAAVHCPLVMVASPSDGAASPARMRETFARFGSSSKREVWLERRTNHQIFWDYDAEPAKQAVVDFFSAPAAGL